MSLKFTSTLLVLVFFSTFCSLKTSADKAIPLITVEETHDDSEYQFVLNPDAIAMIKELSSPVKVISAIGDARVGKSTALNYIHYTLDNAGTSAFHTKKVEQIFVTGNTMKSVTHGVWISTISGKSEMDNVLLLDVEGTDLGNGAVTDRVSIFTALMSSTLMLFMKESPSTHIIEFLFKTVRLSKLVFGEKGSKHWPYLIAVLRGALKPPKGYNNIDEYIIDALISPNINDELDKSRKEIEKRFPEEHIKVFNLPYVADFDVFDQRDVARLLAGYLDGIETLTSNLKNLPDKKSFGGAIMTGQTLADLAERLVEVMNNETLWKGLNPDFYSRFEEDVCRKSYRDFVEPLTAKTMTAKEIRNQKDEKMKLFKEGCILKEKVQSAEHDIELAIIKQEKDEMESGYFKTFVTFVAGYVTHIGYGAAFSDLQLKKNVTLLNDSEYETIGLHGVGWVWNKEAERLGLSGRGSGVVAQEVELFYPWAVTEGHDGYKRVNYFALRLLIKAKKFGHCVVEKNQTYQDPKLFQHIDYSTKIYRANQ